MQGTAETDGALHGGLLDPRNHLVVEIQQTFGISQETSLRQMSDAPNVDFGSGVFCLSHLRAAGPATKPSIVAVLRFHLPA